MADLDRAPFDLDFVLGRMRGEYVRRRDAGDTFFLVRQHTHFALNYEVCTCPKHSCPGCRTLLELLNKLDKAVADLQAQDPERSALEADKAHATWRGQQVALGREVERISAAVRAQHEKSRQQRHHDQTNDPRSRAAGE